MCNAVAIDLEKCCFFAKNDKVHTDIVLANRETGLEKGIRQVALNMKQKSMEAIAIMECTGLDAGTVAEL